MNRIPRFPSRPSVPAHLRREAQREASDLALWQDYHMFLTAQQTLLRAQTAASHAAFERDAQADQAAAQARQAIERLPGDARALFESVLAERRMRVQEDEESLADGRQRQLDPDVIDTQALAELLAEAEGQVESERTPAGWGWFPRGTPDQIRWYAIDVSAALAMPTAASYSAVAAGTTSDMRRRIGFVIFAVVGGVVFLIVWFWFIPHGRTTSASTVAVPVLSVGGASTPVPLAVQPMQQASITANGTTTPIQLGSAAASWPAPTGDVQGYWQQASTVPQRICLTQDLLVGLTALRVAGQGAWPDRVYDIRMSAERPDLVVVSCQQARTQRYGVLVQLSPPASAGLATPQPLPDQPEAALTLRTVAVVGPGQDPSLPSGQGRVVVTVDAPQGLDWPRYAPTLLLLDGQRYLPAETAAQDGQATLRYLVPLPTVEAEAVWEITAPDGQTRRWRTPLSPPRSRSAELAQALQITEVRGTQGADGARQVVLTLHNRSDAAFVLLPSDIHAASRDGAATITLPAVAGLETAFDPGEERTITVTLPDIPLRLTIGASSYQIEGG